MASKKQKTDEVFYSLSINDIQTVATDNFARQLNDAEIKEVIKIVEDSCPWYDLIYNAISELGIEEVENVNENENNSKSIEQIIVKHLKNSTTNGKKSDL